MSLFLNFERQVITVSGNNASEDVLLTTPANNSFVWLDIASGQVPGFTGPKYAYIKKTYTGDRTITADMVFFAIGVGLSGTTTNLEGLSDINTVGFCPGGAQVWFNTGDDDYSGQVILYIARVPSLA